MKGIGKYHSDFDYHMGLLLLSLKLSFLLITLHCTHVKWVGVRASMHKP